MTTTKSPSQAKNSSQNNHFAAAYSHRYMTQPVPTDRLPEESNPASVAYQLLTDEVALDGKPAQNLATFCTTWMEPEADKLIAEGLLYNLADEDEYPHVLQIQKTCVDMMADLFHAPDIATDGGGMGTATIGSSEAMMLAGLAMKFNWRNRRRAAGESTDRPNLIMGTNVQICWKKFARYFDVEPKLLPLEPGRYVVTPDQIAEAVDENTIGVCAVVGSTFTGEFEDVKAINDRLERINAENDWHVPIHVDGASGGFVAPFLYPDLEWDFRVPLVQSINVSGHKYGLCYPGIGWVIWRNRAAVPEDLVFRVNYLGGEMETFTLNFSRPASGVLSQAYNFLRLGREGYTACMTALKSNADFIREQVEAVGDFNILSDDHSLPLVAWAVKESAPYTAFHLSDKLRERGWIVPAYTMPKNAESVTCLRAVVRENMSRTLADDFVADVVWAATDLNQTKPKAAAEAIERESHRGLIC